MSGLDVTLGGAFLAGLLSFLSPCVLPLVPPYLCYLGGVGFEELRDGRTPPAAARRLVLASVAFVLGFALVFIALGATATAIGQTVTRYYDFLGKIAGIVVLVLGLHFLGVFRLGFLDLEKRFHLARAPAGPAGAFVVGLAFAFGWSPCVGPVLATILVLAGGQASAARGGMLLAVYALGLGLPFVLAALAARPFLAVLSGLRGYQRGLERLLGILLVATGLLMFLGSFTQLGAWLLEKIPGLGSLG